MLRSLYTLFMVICSGIYMPLSAQEIIRNLDFEQTDNRRLPVSWMPQNNDDIYFMKLDSAVSQHGKFSVLISLDPAKEGTVGPKAGLLNTGLIKMDYAGHKTITVSGYIRTRGLKGGTASLWMELKGNKQILQGINSDKESPTGDSEWKKYTISLPIDPNTIYISFGCKMTGFGEAWFDNFEILLDELPMK